MRSRFPDSVYRHGDEPDPRFSLANERTFLAWIRTGLALMAAGVALEALVLPIERHLRAFAAIVLVVSGIAAALQAWLTWAGNERAMRLSQPLPSTALRLVVVVAVIVAGAALGVGALW